MTFKEIKFDKEVEALLEEWRKKLQSSSLDELKEDFDNLRLMTENAADTEQRLSLYLTAFVIGREVEARENIPKPPPKRNGLTLINGGKTDK